MLEIRAVCYTDTGEVVFVEESDADAFALFLVEDAALSWVADFCDYGWAVKFSETYAEELDMVLIDRVRNLTSVLP